MNQELEYLTTNSYYSTFDLGLTSALFCLDYELYMVDKDHNPNKAQFIFKRSKDIENSVAAYWNGQLKLDARLYFDAIRCVKNRLYSS